MAELNGGVLTITGDAEDNQVVISGSGIAGDVVLSGAFSGDDAFTATEVNGDTVPVTFAGVTDMVLNLSEGDDTALVTNLHLAGSITGDLGAGDDRFVISGNDSTTAQITLNDESEVEIGPVTVGGNVDLDTGAGDDVIRIVGGSGEENPVTIDGDVILDTGAGADTVALRRVTANNVTIDTAAGDDQVKLRKVDAEVVSVTTGRGNDNVEIRDSLFAKLILQLDQGNDKATLRDVDVEGTLTAQGGAGNDHLALNNVTAIEAVLNTGNGNDSIWLADSEFDDLQVDLGDGHDRLTVEGTTADAFALASSLGRDMVKDRGDNEIPGLEELTEKKNSGKGSSGKS